MANQAKAAKRLGPDVSDFDLDVELRLRNIENRLTYLRYANNETGLNELDPNNRPRVADQELTPPAPTGLGLVANIETVTLTWNEVDFGNFQSYEVQFAKDTAFTDELETYVSKATQFTFTAGDVGTSYFSRVRAITNAGIAGPYSAILDTSTGQVQTANLADDAITTVKITDDAATVTASAFTAGAITVNSTSDTTIQSVTYTSNGSPVQIVFFGFFQQTGGSPAATGTLKIKRGSTEISTAPTVAGGLDGGPRNIEAIDTPSAGSVTYNVTLNDDGTSSGDFSVTNRSLWIIETKR